MRIAAIVLLVASALACAAHAQTGVAELSAGDLAAQIRAGKLKSEDVVKALLDVAEKKKDLNAFITLDREGALKAAREADVLAAKKRFKGPLHGVPLVIKDNIHVAGLPNTAGTPALKNFRPKANAPVADRLVRAGNQTRDAADAAAKDMSNRAQGLIAETRSMLRADRVEPHRLVERVRATLGRATTHPGAIDVFGADGGAVILEGPILSAEVDRVLSAAWSVPGVKRVIDHLERQA